jgi:hypothetical protein
MGMPASTLWPCYLYRHSGTATRCILPHLELELEADGSAVLPLSIHSRLSVLGVVSQQAETQQRAAPLAAEAEQRFLAFDSIMPRVAWRSLVSEHDRRRGGRLCRGQDGHECWARYVTRPQQ